jgi:hypothetical protein
MFSNDDNNSSASSVDGAGSGNVLPTAIATELGDMVVEMASRGDEPGAVRAILHRYRHALVTAAILVLLEIVYMLADRFIGLGGVRTATAANITLSKQ